MSPKKVLIISYHFLPVRHVGVKQFVGYCKYLPEFGWSPIVLTKDWEKEMPPEDEGWGLTFDYELIKGLRLDFKIYRAPYRSHRNILNTLHNVLKGLSGSNEPLWLRFIFTPIRKALSCLWQFFGAYPDNFIGWVNPAVEKASEIIRNERIDVILSNCAPDTNHLVASHLANKFGIPWVAFFDDLFGFYIGEGDRHGNAWRRNLAFMMNKRMLSYASFSLAVSPYMAEYIHQRYGLNGEVAVVGFDEDDFKQYSIKKDDGQFRMLHLGSVYPGDEKPEFFFDALDIFLTRKKEAKDKLKVQFVNSRCEGYLKEALKARPCENIVEFVPYVPYSEAFVLLGSAQVLVLLNLALTGKVKRTLGYPSKIFGYFRSYKPILAIPGDGDWVDYLIQTTKAGSIANSAEEAAKIIEGWYDYWKVNGTLPYAGNVEEVKKFTHRAQSQHIASVLDRMVSGCLKSR